MGEIAPNMDKVEQTTMSNDSGKQISVVKIRFNLNNPVVDTVYDYLQEKRIITKKETQVIKIEDKEIKPEALKNPIPLYDFYAAAGTFSEMQSDKDYTLIEGPENSKNDYFACQIIGDSMNRVIPNGSICLFRFPTAGSKNGKIVLIENIDVQDQDFNSAFTIKTYSSEKNITEDEWQHTSIILRPNSFDKSYKNIILNKEDAQGMKIVGEFIKVLD
jgi:hypothetical protein